MECKDEGEIERPIVLVWLGFVSLGVEESVANFHCVEGWIGDSTVVEISVPPLNVSERAY